VPGYAATVKFAEGIRQTVAWFDADPERRLIDRTADAQWDALIEAYEAGVQYAVAAMEAAARS